MGVEDDDDDDDGDDGMGELSAFSDASHGSSRSEQLYQLEETMLKMHSSLVRIEERASTTPPPTTRTEVVDTSVNERLASLEKQLALIAAAVVTRPDGDRAEAEGASPLRRSQAQSESEIKLEDIVKF